MRSLPIYVLLFCVIATVVMLLSTPATAADAAPSITEVVRAIQCPVCRASVKHTFRNGLKLKKYCSETRDPDRSKCSRSASSREGILNLMEESCTFILNHYRVLKDWNDRAWHLDEVHDVKEATPEPWQKQAVEKACHVGLLNNREHDHFERLIHANLEAGKSEATIIPGLFKRICDRACDPDSYKFDDEL